MVFRAGDNLALFIIYTGNEDHIMQGNKFMLSHVSQVSCLLQKGKLFVNSKAILAFAALCGFGTAKGQRRQKVLVLELVTGRTKGKTKRKHSQSQY